MKRSGLLLTALMITALLLAACGGGGGGAETPVGGTLVPGFGTGTPAAGGGVATGTAPAGVGTGTAEVAVSPTTETGAGTTGTATMPAGSEVGTATAPASGAVTGTPTTTGGTGNVPGTGSQFVLLSDLIAMPVNDQAGQQVGSVNGVIVNSSSTGGTGAVGTPAATEAVGTPAATEAAGTPAATEDTGSGTGSGTGTAMGTSPTISYVVVNVSGSSSSGGAAITPAATETVGAVDTTQTPAATESSSGSGTGGMTSSSNQVLVPWQAFTVSGTSSVPATGSGSTDTTATTTQTPAAGATDMVGTPTVSADSGSGTTQGTMTGALTLTVDQSALAGAPAFDATAFTGSVGPDVASYWSGQGLTIPATGDTTAAGGAFLVQSPITGMEVMDNSGQSFGQVQDFVVDTTTGELVYAVLTGGSTLGSNFYVVPFSALSWQSGAAGTMAGQIQSNVSSDAFTAAPSITSIDELDFSSADWQSEFDTYWQSVK